MILRSCIWLTKKYGNLAPVGGGGGPSQNAFFFKMLFQLKIKEPQPVGTASSRRDKFAEKDARVMADHAQA